LRVIVHRSQLTCQPRRPSFLPSRPKTTKFASAGSRLNLCGGPRRRCTVDG